AYNNKLEEIIERKARSLPETSDYESRNKIYRYAASRGFESDLIIAALKRVLRRLNSTP
ncbi:MAG: RecX family transcriptional regulator, partial [Muribaculaceae bacterium]|nr:RecX family transcriptional regulator [Muribaculaceae bacterium]